MIQIYKLSWKQTWPEWDARVEADAEKRLQASDLKLANDIIKRIKSM